MRKILLTGGDGFVAKHAVPAFLRAGWSIRSAVRASGSRSADGVETAAIGDFRAADWGPLLKDVEVVVHLAARAHRLGRAGTDDPDAFRADNLEVTASLGRAAARAGVRRFIFLSSVKAMGESTPIDAPWTEDSPCRPSDAYGESKLAAEQELRRIGLPVTVLRSPLVYGRGVKANFRRLIGLTRGGVPLPLGAVRNSRSLIYGGNLADALRTAAESPSAEGTFLISDGEDLSTPELIRRLARALGVPARLWPVPPTMLAWGAAMLGRSDEARRLFESLRVDSSRFRRATGWVPPFSVDEGLLATVAGEEPA